MFKFLLLLCAFAVVALGLATDGIAAVTPVKLGSYNITTTTVSGLSSGGFMAVQYHVAFSASVSGAAIFAGGPYYCAEGNIVYAEERCMSVTMGKPNTSKLVSYTTNEAVLGKIDNPSHLTGGKVYLYSGSGDSVVDQSVVKSLQTYYSYFIDTASIVADYNVASEHCLPTLNYGENCLSLKSPFIGKCNFDGAYNALSNLYGDDLVAGTAVDKNLFAFDQTPFLVKSASIGDTGYIYVPTACADKKTACRLHISFHGCQQTIQDIGNQYAANTGFNSWAEANNIIVLYPYVTPSYNKPSNPNGCWDWWAYTGTDYAVKSGKQMQFVNSIVNHLKGGK